MKSSFPLACHLRIAVYYTIFVILFGAIVRISGSGAGCGQHWPSCHGEIAHLPQTLETAIEQTHRLTSGLAMLYVFFLTFKTWKLLPPGHVARRCALWSSILMITEALVGAGLVLLELVGKNDSVSRALVMALHLLNTSALLFAMLGAAWASRFPAQLHSLRLFGGLKPGHGDPRPSALTTHGGFWGEHVYWVGALLVLVVSAAGAVTALGDTVYPVGDRSSLQVAREMAGSGGHFLEHLRSVHPILASLAVPFWISAAARFSGKWGWFIIASAALQVLAGLFNIYLSAPGWMQVIHLALANALWVSWTLAWFSRHDAPA